MKKIFLMALSLGYLNADVQLDKQIAGITMLGFYGTDISQNTQLQNELKFGLGGVILFDRNPLDKNKPKNIVDKEQLKTLNAQLQSYSNNSLLIGIDQEGGKIERLKSKMGFIHTPSAKELGDKDDINATKQAYDAMAKELHETGFTLDFAPVVDLNANPNNTVIVGNERAYGTTPQKVTKHAQIFVNSLKEQGIVSVLKHFPGHGSSLGDSHKGFVNSSTTWHENELEPFVKIDTPMIMSAHIYLEQLDDKYPATLSKKILTDKLRGEMGYKGAVISDDMQMGAIDDNFSREKSIELALNAGIDMLLYANQNGEQVSLKDIIGIVNKLITEGKVKKERIEVAYERIEALKKEHHLNTIMDNNLTTATLIDNEGGAKKKSKSKCKTKMRKVKVRVD